MVGEVLPEEQFPIYETPRDLYELYMNARASLSTVSGFYQLYFKLIYLIDIGKEMLPVSLEGLRTEAESLLSDVKTYPEPGQMEFTGNDTYRLGSSSSNTGLIEVRTEELQIGRDEVKDQQAMTLIPKMRAMDSKIFKTLIDTGVIDIKKPLLEELMTQDVMASIQEKVMNNYRMEHPEEFKEEEPKKE